MDNLVLLERIYSGRRAELKRIILNEALFCFLNDGIESTTIEMIRDRANTSIGAIYHHFKNKEGIVRALYLAALQDHAQRREHALQSVQSLQQGVETIVASYVDWVVDFPDFARFLYAANFILTKSDDVSELKQKNHQRNQHLLAWMKQQSNSVFLQNIPYELLLSLVIGATESYCRAWLSGKVSTSPMVYKQTLSQAAWHSMSCIATSENKAK